MGGALALGHSPVAQPVCRVWPSATDTMPRASAARLPKSRIGGLHGKKGPGVRTMGLGTGCAGGWSAIESVWRARAGDVIAGSGEVVIEAYNEVAWVAESQAELARDLSERALLFDFDTADLSGNDLARTRVMSSSCACHNFARNYWASLCSETRRFLRATWHDARYVTVVRMDGRS